MSRRAASRRARRSPLPWLALLVWSAWAYALQGRLASGAPAAWVPDLGLALLLALERRLTAGEALAAALVVSAARSALGADAPAAVLAATTGCVAAVRWLGAFAEIDRPAARAVLAGLAAGATAGLLAVARHAREGLGAEGIALPGGAVARVALATALAALLLGPLLARLPGLTPLRGRPSP